MKKLLFLFLAMFTTGVVAQAQVALGVKAGASTSKVDIKNIRSSVSDFKASDDITGYHVGGFLRLKAANFSLQPEAYFTSTGGKIEITDTGSGTNVNTEKITFNRLDVPIMVGYNFFNFARVQAGPVASVLVNGKLGDQKLEDYMNKSDWGWQAGVGFDIGSFTADLRYENVRRDFTNSSTSFDVDNNQFILSLGFKLLGK